MARERVSVGPHHLHVSWVINVGRRPNITDGNPGIARHLCQGVCRKLRFGKYSRKVPVLHQIKDRNYIVRGDVSTVAANERLHLESVTGTEVSIGVVEGDQHAPA